MLHTYTHAMEQAHSPDPNLLACIAVLHFLNRDFKAATHFFGEALKHD